MNASILTAGLACPSLLIVSHHRLCSLVLLLPLALVMLSRPTAAFRQLALRSRPSSSAATAAGATAAARRPFSISCLPVLRRASPLSPSFFVPSLSSSTRLMAGAAAPDPRIKVRASHILVRREEGREEGKEGGREQDGSER